MSWTNQLGKLTKMWRLLNIKSEYLIFVHTKTLQPYTNPGGAPSNIKSTRKEKVVNYLTSFMRELLSRLTSLEICALEKITKVKTTTNSKVIWIVVKFATRRTVMTNIRRYIIGSNFFAQNCKLYWKWDVWNI